VSASFGTNTNHPFRIKANNSGLLHVYPTGEVVVGSNTTGSFGRFTVETLNNSYGMSHLGENGNILATRMGGTSAGIGTFSNTNMRLFANGSSALIIDAANGNIGIGTDAPTTRLHISGDGRIDGLLGIGTGASPGIAFHINDDGEAVRLSGNQPYMNFFNGVDYRGLIGITALTDITLGTVGSNTNGKLNFNTLGTTRMTIQSNGQVSVNGPPAPNGSPSFTVNGNGILSLISGSSEWTIRPEGCFDPGGPCLFFDANGFTRAKIDADGDWVVLSDRTAKDAIKKYDPVLEKIKNLEVSTYHYRRDKPGTRSFGLIAQNVAEYFPEITQPMPGPGGENLLGVAYNKVGVLAIKAIQEQQDIIEKQQGKIESLEKRLASLEKLLLNK
jgi:hypothetical protein